MSTDIKQFRGIWLPAHEQHLPGWMQQDNTMVDGKAAYQFKKITAAMNHVKQFRVAVDVGAHVGLWSMHLVKRFQHVHAFEPIKDHRVCYGKNLEGAHNYTLYPVALGNHAGGVRLLVCQGSSGDTRVVGEGEGQGEFATLKRLDEVLDEGCVDATQVDFIKLDCEGYEIFALQGAEALLKRCKPCVCVEQKPGHARRHGAPEKGAVDYLRSLGARDRLEISGDFIMSWDEVSP